MSAIFGIFYLDGRSVQPAELQQMAAALQHRGAVGNAMWSLGSVGMGYCSHFPCGVAITTPGFGGASNLAIVADARLDNREELISLLGMGKNGAEVNDAYLIVEAYQRWGEVCAEHLLGDFAFAFWDGRRRQLFCARDHVGVKPFYYCHLPRRIFAWATEIKALFCLSSLPQQIDEERLAEQMARIDGDLTDQTTLYRYLLSLPPAHTVKVSGGETVLNRYWSLDPGRSLEVGSARDHAEAFGDLFRAAVQCRLRSPGAVGALLSGGLDSSAIAWMAQSLPHGQPEGKLPTFSAVFDTVTVCDERVYIDPVLARGSFAPHWVAGDQASLLAELERLICRQEDLFYAPGIFLVSTLYRAAQRQGVSVLLDGHGGDEVTGCGAGYYRELARKARWITLTREVQASARLYQESFWTLFWPYLRYGGRAAARFLRFRHYLPWSRPTSVSAGRAGDNLPIWERLLQPDFVQRTRLRERYRAFQLRRPQQADSEREGHYRLLTGRAQVRALEVLNKASAVYSVDLRFPFWDKRLVEFCLALPSEHKLYRGWDRITLRRAMQDRLPPQVQWRMEKTDFTPNLVHVLRTHDREALDQLLLGPHKRVTDYLNGVAMGAAYREFLAQDQPAPILLQMVLQATIISLWLQGCHDIHLSNS